MHSPVYHASRANKISFAAVGGKSQYRSSASRRAILTRFLYFSPEEKLGPDQLLAMLCLVKILAFKSSKEFRVWLAANHGQPDGIWMQIFKKGSATPTITYAEALDEALCYGWIDGQKQKHDEHSWRQKFTPRRPGSGWSKINTTHVERLLNAGLMHAAGLKAVETAKADGRWASAYNSQRNSVIPEDFLAALKKNKKAGLFFKALNKANLYSITYRLQTAKKTETRAKRMETIMAMLERGETFHPQSKKQTLKPSSSRRGSPAK